MTKTKTQKAKAKANRANNVQQPQKVAGKKKKQGPKAGSRVGQQMQVRGSGNLGAVVGPVFTKLGLADIRRQKVAWVMGYTFVGSAADGVANAVYFVDSTSTLMVGGAAYQAGSGWVPIAGSDTKLGASYVSDIEKHFARKVVHRQKVIVESLNPSTANNMVAVLGFGRGGNICLATKPNVLATAGLQANALTAVSSVADTLVVASYETKELDLTHLIAGGSGPLQNEFDIQASNLGNAGGYSTVLVAGSQIGAIAPDLTGIIPACLCVAGQNTTAALQATNVHQIVIEQEVSFLDFLGGMVTEYPIE